MHFAPKHRFQTLQKLDTSSIATDNWNAVQKYLPRNKQQGFAIATPEQFSEIEVLVSPNRYYMPWPVTHLRLFTTYETHAKLAVAIGRHLNDHRLASNVPASVASLAP